MKRNTRKRWIGMLSLALIAGAAIVVVLGVFAGTGDFTISGSLGVGTDAPQEKLHVLSTGTTRIKCEGSATSLYISTGAAADIQLGRVNIGLYANFLFADSKSFGTLKQWAMGLRPGNSDLHFYSDAGGFEAMTLTQAGNVGIGTTNPNEQLEIGGNFRLPPTTATTGIIYSGENRFIHNYSNSFFAGVNAGNLTMTGAYNTAVGDEALRYNTTGGWNTAVGDQALYSNTTGGSNTAVGNLALYSNTTGGSNTAVGPGALYSNTTGDCNTAVGPGALDSNTTGYYNTALGIEADVSTGNLHNATAIGYEAIVNASNKVRIGDTNVTVIEGQVGWTASSDRTKKENFLAVDGPEVLKKLSDIPVNSWNYIGQDHTQFRHYGPCAQDIFAAFGQDTLGTIGTDTTITGSDLDGILMISIQTLYQMTLELEEKTNEIDNLGAQIEALLERTAELEQVVGEMQE